MQRHDLVVRAAPADGAATTTLLLATLAGERQDDTLRTTSDLDTVLDRLQVDGRAGTADDLADVRALRSRLVEVVTADDSRAAVEILNDTLTASRAALVLDPGPDGSDEWHWTLRLPAGASIADRLTVRVVPGLLHLVASHALVRFRRCEAERCAGLYVDASKAGRRRFCDPARCGTRTHVAAHRARESR